MAHKLFDILGHWSGYNVYIGANNPENTASLTYLHIYISKTPEDFLRSLPKFPLPPKSSFPLLIAEFYDGTIKHVTPLSSSLFDSTPVKRSPVLYTIPVFQINIRNGVIFQGDSFAFTLDIKGNLFSFLQTFKRIKCPPQSLINYYENIIDYFKPPISLKFYFESVFESNSMNVYCNSTTYLLNIKKAYQLKAQLLSEKSYSKKALSRFIYKTKNPKLNPFTTITLCRCHKFNAANLICISGLKGDWNVLNGIHKITITVGNNYYYPKTFVDNISESSYIRVVFDSSQLVDYNLNIHGIAKLKSVQKPIKNNSSYRTLIGGVIDIARNLGPHTHTGILPWTLPISESPLKSNRIILDTYKEINENFNNPSFSKVEYQIRNPILHCAQYYNNPSMVLNEGFYFFNNKYGIEPVNYNIPFKNYLEPKTLRYMSFNIKDSNLTYEALSNLVMINKKAFPDIFEYLLSPTPIPIFKPDISGPNPILLSSIERLNVGMISLSLTKGKRIGYIRLGGFSFYDPDSLIRNPLVCINQTPTLESSKMYSTLTRYLKHKLNVEAVIIDDRNDGGGDTTHPGGFRSVFGGDYKIYDTYTKKFGGSDADIFSNLEESKNTPLLYKDLSSKVLKLGSQPSEIESLFGDVILKGSCKNPFHIYYMTSVMSISSGDLLKHLMKGACLNGNLGNNTYVTTIGDTYGVLVGESSNPQSIPTNINICLNRITEEIPNNTSFEYRYEYGIVEFVPSQNKFTNEIEPRLAPELLLPHSWCIVYRDLGYEKDNFPYLNSTEPEPDQERTWKDTWLEMAIRYDLKQMGKINFEELYRTECIDNYHHDEKLRNLVTKQLNSIYI
jgi:hypothetical protein